MTDQNVTVYDNEMAAFLASMVNKDDTGGSITGPPTLKINYDEDSVWTRGEWVVGQRKAKAADGTVAITEQGSMAKGLVVLLARNRWSYYNNKDTSKNCNSKFYLRGEMVRGNKYKNICGKTCPMRDVNLNPRCKCQIVIMGVAVTPEGKFIDCMSYLGGDSYMPVQNYLESIERDRVQGGYSDPRPLFRLLTLLGSNKKQNEGTKYYQAVLTEGGRFQNREQLVSFQAKRDEALEYIKRSNEMFDAQEMDADLAAQAQAQASAAPPQAPQTVIPGTGMQTLNVGNAGAPPSVSTTPVVDESVPDFAKMMTAANAPAPEPWIDGEVVQPTAPETPNVVHPEPAAQGTDDPDFDLLGTIEKMINK